MVGVASGDLGVWEFVVVLGFSFTVRGGLGWGYGVPGDLCIRGLGVIVGGVYGGEVLDDGVL